MRKKGSLLVSLCALVLLFPGFDAFAVGKRRAVSPVRPVTLHVLTNLEGLPAGDGVFIEVDGRRAGITGADGTLRTVVSPGIRNVRAFLPGLAAGTASVTAILGAQATVTVNLIDSEAVEPAILVIDQVANAILPRDFSTFTLELRNISGTRIPMRRIDSIQLESAFASDLGLTPIDVQPLLTLQSSSRVVASAAQLPALRDALESLPAGPAVLSVTGADDDGVLYTGSTEFSIGRYRLSVTLVVPPSNPNLVLSNRTVQVTVLNTTIDLRITTNTQGQFVTVLPAGTAALDLEITDGGRYYYARTSLTMNANIEAIVPVVNVADLQQGTSSATVTRFAAQWQPPTADRIANRAAAAQIGEISCDAMASAESEDQRVTNVRRVTVQKGSETVTLRYLVHSYEYPEYVRQQSIYDDVWELGLYAPNGKSLFGLTRQVNSQLYGEPVWQSDGTTDTIDRRIDVAELTKNGPVDLTLFVAATNVGDGLLETSVCAALTLGAELAIERVTPSSGSAFGLAENLDIPSTTSSTKVFSIPNRSSTNTYPVSFDVVVTPDAKSVNRVVVELLDADSRLPIASGPILDITSGIGRVDDKTLRIPVTMTSGRPSTVDAPPPQATRIVYRFTVKSTTAEASRDSSVWKALWKWPGDTLAIGRYSTRDSGGDDWCSRGTYDWIEQNVALLKTTYVNDISGEHGRNIGHKEHKRGTDLDLFHFTVFSTTRSGTDNYVQLRKKVFAAIDGNATAKAEVTTFFTTTRTRLAALRDMSEVRVLIFGIGDATPRTSGVSLPSGWMRSLLVAGRVESNGTDLLNIGSSWSDGSKLRYDTIHNNHIHVGLSEAEVDN